MNMFKKILFIISLIASFNFVFAQGIVVNKPGGGKDTLRISRIDSITFNPDMVVHYSTGVSQTYQTSGIDSLAFNYHLVAAPVVTSLSPSYVGAGSGATTITVNGNNFLPTSVVRFNGSTYATTYVSSSELQFTALAGDLTTAGNLSVSVYTPTAGSDTSSSSLLSVLSSTSESFNAGGKAAYAAADLTLASGTYNLSDALTGNLAGDVKNGAFSVRIQNSGKITMKFDLTSGCSTASFQYAKYSTNATTTVELWYSTDQGTSWTKAGSTISVSNATTFQTATFTINIAGNIRFEVRKTDGANRCNIDDLTFAPYSSSSNSVPDISNINPGSTEAGGAGFTLAVTGSRFINGSVVRWNGTALTTTYLSSSLLSATVPAENVASGGTANITVYTPPTGGGVSTIIPFTISTTTNPAPSISSISPTTVVASSGQFTLTVNGTGFISSSVVKWNGTALTTTYVSSTQLTAVVPAGNITSSGSATITVYTGTPGGGTSSGSTLTISSTNPTPVLSSISPTNTTAGSAQFTLTVNGTSFSNTSVVKWSGTALTTTYVSSTQLTAVVPATNVASAGTATVTVYTGTPGGGTSSGSTFTINSAVAVNENLIMGNPSNAVTSVSSPNNYLIQHAQYCLSYDRDRAIPNWVSWHLNSAWLTDNSTRKDNFIADPYVPTAWFSPDGTAYSNTGFSRGHMCPSADRVNTQSDNDSLFYMTNMVPQNQTNNGGIWGTFEDYCRTLVPGGNEVYIISGGYGNGGLNASGVTVNWINSNRIAVPAKLWKVVLVLPEGDNDPSRVTTSTRVIGFMINNDAGPFTSWGDYRVSVDSIEALTGYDFFSNVDPAIQAVIEARVDSAK